jgi:hypothetical protein
LQQAIREAQQNARANVLVIPPECCDPEAASLKRAARHLSGVLHRLWTQSEGRPEVFLAGIEQWFEDASDRASGWFKRKLAPKLFAVGLVVAIALNVDTLEILSRLSGDPELRRAVVETAIERVETESGDGATAAAQAEFEDEFRRAKQELLQLEPLLGWRASDASDQPADENRDRLDAPTDAGTDPETEAKNASDAAVDQAGADWLWWLHKIIGLLATAIALSLGAPFWFDVLQKLVRIRASVSPADVEKRDAARQQYRVAAGAGGAPGPDVALPVPAHGAGPDEPAQARLVSGMVGLAPKADAPDRKNARWMAELASLAYTEDREAVERALRPLGLNLEKWLDRREISLHGSFKAIDTQGFVAGGRDLVVVAFRGTEVEADNPADVLTDLQAWKRPMPGFEQLDEDRRPRAHHGFVEALEAVEDDLWAALERLGTENPARPVWFAGHSLGGALAVLAAAVYSLRRDAENRARENRAERWLQELGDQADDAALAAVDRRIRTEAPPLPPVGWIHTIGQPAVADPRLAEWLERRFGRRLVRTVNNRDIVPRLPSRLIGYAHAGAELYFDSFGRMKLDPGAWYRGLDALVIDPDEAARRAREAVGDHDRETYIALLKGRGDRD